MVADDPLAGLKGGGSMALEFSGAYYIFRSLISKPNGSVNVMRFAGKLLIVAVLVALLDPLTGRLFTYDLVKGLTGYVKADYDYSLTVESGSVFRNGLVRAMGPFEHSILFGCVCTWLGIIALLTFKEGIFGKMVASVALIGVWFSQARGPLVGYIVGVLLIFGYLRTQEFTWRWKVVGAVVAFVVASIFMYSGTPVATLMRVLGIDAETGWYRQLIWETAGPLVLKAPLFGVGLGDDWGWQNSDLAGSSVDSLWLRSAMNFGIVGALLVFLTLFGSVWRGPVDKSHHLTVEEQRLSVALGIVLTVAIYLGFTVHMWGACWVLLGAIAGIRANLAEAAIARKELFP
jgi:O-antigen ligase